MLVSLLLLLVACTGSETRKQAPMASSQEPSVLREDLEYPLEKSIATVQIDNPYGEINVRDHKSAAVGIHGVIQRLPPDFARARVVSTREGGVLHLKVEMADGETGGRYDMAAYVPEGMALILNGMNDRVDARKRKGPLTVTSQGGDINASSQGRLDLATVSGTIKAAAMAARWPGNSRIRSTSGRIIVLVPLSGDVALHAETGGRLTTDFGLSVHPRAGGGSVANARYGAGTSILQVLSDSGEVVLDQAVLLEEDAGMVPDVD